MLLCRTKWRQTLLWLENVLKIPFEISTIAIICCSAFWPTSKESCFSSWGQHGAHLGPVGPRWAPCWPYEPCYRGNYYQLENTSTDLIKQTSPGVADSNACQNLLISGIVRYFTCHSKTSAAETDIFHDKKPGIMTSSNGNIFWVTGPLWGDSTDHRSIPLTKASDAEL